jgi:hypothetical protein
VLAARDAVELLMREAEQRILLLCLVEHRRSVSLPFPGTLLEAGEAELS